MHCRMCTFGSAGSNIGCHDGALLVICEHDHVSWDEAAQQSHSTAATHKTQTGGKGRKEKEAGKAAPAPAPA